MKRKSGSFSFSPLTANDHARVAIYVRVSSTMQVEDGFSLEAQLKACQKFAADRGWHVVEVYEEPGVSAKDDNRPAFQRMIRDARNGKFNVILTHKLDRFSRSILDVLTYLRDLHDWGVAYVSATEHFDFSTPMGKMQLHIMAALAQWYLDNLSQEITKGKKARAEAGFWNGDLAFGYRTTNARTIEVEEKEAEAVRLAFKLCAAGTHTYVDIARVLNEAGFRTHGKGKRAGQTFTKFSIRAMLMNRFYLGYAKYRRPDGWKQFDYFPGQHPAIIDEALWNKAQAAIQSRHARRRHAKSQDRVYPLTGLLLCAKCHSPFRGQSARGFTYYRDSAHDYGRECSEKMVRSQILEDQLVAYFSRLKITDSVKKKAIRRLGVGVDLKRAEQERIGLQNQLERAKQLFLMGDWSEVKYLQEKARIEMALAQLEPSPQPAVDIQEAARLLETYGAVLGRANEAEKKAFFSAVLSEVYVKDKKIAAIRPKPNYYDLLSMSEVRPNGFEPSQPFGH